MKRLLLFEFEDLHWFPANIRNYGTDFLQFVANTFGFYENIHHILIKGIKSSGTTQVIDLASGGGGGWLKISEKLGAAVQGLKIMLTDYYPNLDAFQRMKNEGAPYIGFKENSISALDVPAHLKGLRTMFLSFHHFAPASARAILQDAVNDQAPIAIFEAQDRSIGNLIKFFFSPINVILMTPFIRPFKWGRLLFTYLIPIVPLFVWWDGLVSVLRTYSSAELQAMTKQLDGGHLYEWEISKIKNRQVMIYYLLGYPKGSVS